MTPTDAPITDAELDLLERTIPHLMFSQNDVRCLIDALRRERAENAALVNAAYADSVLHAQEMTDLQVKMNQMMYDQQIDYVRALADKDAQIAKLSEPITADGAAGSGE